MTPRKRAEEAYGAINQAMENIDADALPSIESMCEDRDWVHLFLELEVVEAFLDRILEKQS